MNFIPDNIIRAVCWTLLHSLWQGLILAVVAGAVMVFTRKAKSTTRYNLLGILVLAFLVVSGYTFSHELRLPSGTEVAVPKVATAADVAVPVVVVHEAPGLRDVSPLESLVRYFNEHASMVVVIWFIIAMARFVKVLSSLVYAQRIRHYGTVAAPAEWQERVGELLGQLSRNRHVLLLESKLIQVPAVVGFLKPVILVPVGMLAQLPADQVESILLHELAHICRRDYLFNVVQYLVDTLFFFNPALLWVSSLIRTERENCCDDVAIRETRSRRQLIEALLSFHEYQKKTRGYTLAFAGKDGGVVKRVERIVHKKNHSLNPGERTLLMGGLLLLCGAFVTIRPSSAPVTPVVIKEKMVAAPEAAGVVAGAAMLPGVVAAGEPGVVRGGEPGVVTAGEPGVGAQLADTNIKDEKNDTSLPGHLSDRDIEKLIEARDHGVTPEFVAELKKMGYSLNLDKAIELKDHGVSAEFIQSLKKEGFGQVSLDRAIELIDHGVSVEFIKHIRAAGFPKLTLEQAVELVDHGVNGEFIEKWKKKTGTLLELEDYVHLRDSGIDPS